LVACSETNQVKPDSPNVKDQEKQIEVEFEKVNGILFNSLNQTTGKSNGRIASSTDIESALVQNLVAVYGDEAASQYAEIKVALDKKEPLKLSQNVEKYYTQFKNQLAVSYVSYAESSLDTTHYESFKKYFYSDLEKIYKTAKESQTLNEDEIIQLYTLLQSVKLGFEALVYCNSLEDESTTVNGRRRCIAFCHFWPKLDPTTTNGNCNWGVIGTQGGVGAIIGAGIGCAVTIPTCAGATVGGVIGGVVGVYSGVIVVAANSPCK
jgi:hypothetical protein